MNEERAHLRYNILITERVLPYDPSQFPFDALLQELFRCQDLSRLHEQLAEDVRYDLHDRSSNTHTCFHDQYFGRLNEGWPEFFELYHRFVRQVVAPALEEQELIVQKKPTLRVALPGNTAGGPFHTDAEYNHPPASLNFLVPITRMFESNTLLAESKPGKGDYRHFTLAPGDLLHFDGTHCRHGNLVNTTGVTRVSMDFRVIRPREYDPESGLRTFNAGIPFTVGRYYDRLKI